MELFSNIFRSFLAPFIPEELLFETIVSTVSVCSKTGYGQICGQKPLLRFQATIRQIQEAVFFVPL